MSQIKANPIPLSCAVLALSMAVCVGSAGAAEAAALRAQQTSQSQQRVSLEQLLEALQQAAKDYNDRLDGQALAAERDAIRPVLSLASIQPVAINTPSVCVTPLREALLNLPPPSL